MKLRLELVTCKLLKCRKIKKTKDNLCYRHIQEYLTKLLRTISTREKVPVDFLTKEVHVWPDFHGNRSPIADPTLKGMVCY